MWDDQRFKTLSIDGIIDVAHALRHIKLWTRPAGLSVFVDSVHWLDCAFANKGGMQSTLSGKVCRFIELFINRLVLLGFTSRVQLRQPISWLRRQKNKKIRLFWNTVGTWISNDMQEISWKATSWPGFLLTPGLSDLSIVLFVCVVWSWIPKHRIKQHKRRIGMRLLCCR